MCAILQLGYSFVKSNYIGKEQIMNNVRQFIFPGAIIGSLVLASFGYTVMARVPKTSTQPPAAVQNDAVGENLQPKPLPDRSNVENTRSKCTLNPGYPQDVRQWCSQIMRHANKNNLDPNLIAAVIWQESRRVVRSD
jgi:soluble lytic murein transglycosylase-like protein